MDFSNMHEFLADKSIFLTGATGYIAKILLEKILRIQPNVKKIYLLIRASDAKSADARFQNEIISKELFRVVREKWGADFESFISEKITTVPGDTSCQSLGVVDDELQELYENVDLIINVAATTKFGERYDVALGVNTIGAEHMVIFAKNCAKLQLLVHVSTAYVCGEKKGLIHEEPYVIGEALNARVALDIHSEKKLVYQALNHLKATDIPESQIKQKMKSLGRQRYRLFL